MSPAGTMESRRTPPAEAEIAQQYRYQWQRIGFSYARDSLAGTLDFWMRLSRAYRTAALAIQGVHDDHSHFFPRRLPGLHLR